MTQTIRMSLEAARVNAGMTQAEVCEAIKISHTTIWLWESGKRVPPVDKAIALAELYHIPLEAINFCKKS